MYREDLRGSWFNNGKAAMLYVDESTFEQKKEPEFYVVNEREKHLIRVRDEKQIQLLNYCFYGPKLKPEAIKWLIDPSGGKLTYFDSVDDYIAYHNNMMEELNRE